MADGICFSSSVGHVGANEAKSIMRKALMPRAAKAASWSSELLPSRLMTLRRLLGEHRRFATHRCIHTRSPPSPSRRIALFSSVALKRWQRAYLQNRRTRACRCPGVSVPSHVRPLVVALPTTSLSKIQGQTLASRPQNTANHSLAYNTRLFHAEKGILREQYSGPC